MSSLPTDVPGGDDAGAGLLAAALRTVAQPVWVVDGDGLIRFANPAALATLGYSDVGELIGLDRHRTIHHHRPDGRPYPAAECPMSRSRATGETVTSDLDWFFRRDGSMFRVSYISAPLEMPGGRGAVVAFNDIESGLHAAVAPHEHDTRLTGQEEALRRVAALVARGSEPTAVFGAVADEAQALLGVDIAAIIRFEIDGTATAVGVHGGPHAAGERVQVDPGDVVASVRVTGQAARFDGEEPHLAPVTPRGAGAAGVGSVLAAPLVIDGELWGAIRVGSLGRSLPAVMNRRLADFTELVAAVISSAQEREDLRRVADEQAALHRVATLAAAESAPTEVLAKVTEEAAQVIGNVDCALCRDDRDGTITVLAAWGEGQLGTMRVGERFPVDGTGVVARVLDEGHLCRIEDYATTTGVLAERGQAYGIRSAAGCPIVVSGRVWGVLVVARYGAEPLPLKSERRIGQFAELAATAVANFAARREVERLAEEQAALRRVATLVAEGAAPGEVLDAVAGEMEALLDADQVALNRFEPGEQILVLAHRGLDVARTPVGSRVSTAGESVTATVRRTGRPARMEHHPGAEGALAELARATGLRLSVSAPITVEGRLWGLITTSWKGNQTPAGDTEERMVRFAQLLGTAIANADSRVALRRLADEQAALRRVATLVAQDVAPDDLFEAVAREVGALFGADYTGMIRYEAEVGFVTTMATWAAVGDHPPAPARSRIVPGDPTAVIAETGRPARVDDWGNIPGPISRFVREELAVKSSVGSPIVVTGRLWGALAVHSRAGPFPPDTESRLLSFTELVATAIANTSARGEVSRLAEEQAALRRVATLVAQGGQPSEVFDTVAAELVGLLQADHVVVGRYEPGTELTVLAYRGTGPEIPPGTRIDHAGDSVEAVVWRTERSARVEYEGVPGMIAELARAAGVQVAVGAPVVVDGRLWGVASAGWNWGRRPPADAEARMAKFAELLDTAIANADGRDQLTASRARLVTEADEARRRVVRDLHDGAQQRLVHTIVTLKLAQRAVRSSENEVGPLVAEALEQAEEGNRELRELAHGILPVSLTRGGLRAGVKAVVARLDLPVQVNVPAERLPTEVEASAYFVMAEALTNVVKHAQADTAMVSAFVDDGMLRVEVRDDGRGGADPRGHGLVGLADRVTALGGWLTVESTAGAGTVLSAALPLSSG